MAKASKAAREKSWPAAEKAARSSSGSEMVTCCMGSGYRKNPSNALARCELAENSQNLEPSGKLRIAARFSIVQKSFLFLISVIGFPGFVKNSSEKRSKIACGNNTRGFVAIKREKPGLVAGHQIVGLARFAHAQQKIV